MCLIFGAWAVASPGSLSGLLAPFGVEESVGVTRSVIHTATRPTIETSDEPLPGVDTSQMVGSGVVSGVEALIGEVTQTWKSFFGMAETKIDQGAELKEKAEQAKDSFDQLQKSYDQFTSFSGSPQ